MPNKIKIFLSATAVVAFAAIFFSNAQFEKIAEPPRAAFVAFSPGKESLALILEGIAKSKRSIHVAAYSFTSKPIATALLDAHKREVRVRVVVDSKANKGKYSAATFLANNGVPVRSNANYAILHHKFMVFDEAGVETGSFNYSASAVNKNAENVLYLQNAPELARKYIREWQRLWDEGIPVAPKY